MTMLVPALDMALLDRWQRDFPLVPRPFAELGRCLGLEEADVIDRLGDLVAHGFVSRVGAVVRPNTAGASTLAAMAVPPARLEQVAARVSAEAAVNHNYEREHRLNLWFVVAATDRAGVADTLARIETDTALGVLDLPLERAYHIDLGFRLSGEGESPPERRGGAARIAPDEHDRSLLAALEDGLPLDPRPYELLAQGLGFAERDVTDRLDRLIRGGVISRFGIVVKHRRLGYRANAMAVWDVPDDAVDRIAATFTSHSFVTLCYRRPRRQPQWPYNLFCMVHGRDRGTVRGQIATLNEAAGAGALPQAILFSRCCFKQRGARFAVPRAEAVA